MTWSAARASRRYRDTHQRSRQADLALAMGKGEALLDKRRFLICPSARATASSFVDYYRDEPRRDTPSLLKTMKRPTLVIAAGEDRVVTDLPARMKGVNNRNVRFVVIADASHMFLDFFLEDAADEIGKFLKGLF
jgi:pimeloyl-ACP methyl ester carboxylesterase